MSIERLRRLRTAAGGGTAAPPPRPLPVKPDVIVHVEPPKVPPLGRCTNCTKPAKWWFQLRDKNPDIRYFINNQRTDGPSYLQFCGVQCANASAGQDEVVVRAPSA